MRCLYRIDRVLVLLEKILIIIIFGALIGSIFFNIVTRNFFGISFHVILENSPAMVLWLALLGSSLALQSNRHIKIDLVLRFCTPEFRSIAHAVSCIFGMAVMGLLFYVSLDFVKNEIDIFGWKGYLSVVFPSFFSISLFRFFVSMIRENEQRRHTHEAHSKSETPKRATK